jgi:energy-coupling factor transport system permease protein
LNNIALGQYIKGDSLIHKLDPRIKITSLVIYLVSVFMIEISPNTINLIMIGSLLALILIAYIFSGIPLFRILNSIKSIIFLIVFTVIIQLFAIKDGTLLFNPTMYIGLASVVSILVLLVVYGYLKKYVKFKTSLFILVVVLIFVLQYFLPYMTWFKYDLAIYDQALLRGLFLFLRIMAVILSTSLLTYTTSTNDFNSGLESLLGFLKIIKIPVATFSMIVSLTLRSIPILLQESDTVLKAQASRGSDIRESNILGKVKQVISFLVPLLVISFQKAIDLADAMEVRGYVVGAKRTHYDSFKLRSADILFFLFIVLVLVATILVPTLI